MAFLTQRLVALVYLLGKLMIIDVLVDYVTTDYKAVFFVNNRLSVISGMRTLPAANPGTIGIGCIIRITPLIFDCLENFLDLCLKFNLPF